MKFLKLITLNILALTAVFTTVCMHEEISRVDHIYGEILDAFKSRIIQDFDTFQDSHEGIMLAQRIGELTQDEKNSLLKSINHMAGDKLYSIGRPYLKILVLAGADVNYNFEYRLRPPTLLSKAIHYNDLDMVNFLLAHHADTTTVYLSGPLLDSVETYPIAEALVKHRALEPYIREEPYNQGTRQQILLDKNFANADYDTRLTPLYKKALEEQYGINLNFNVKDDFGNTLLHKLLLYAPKYGQVKFFEKFRILLNENAVDLTSTNRQGESPIDIVKSFGRTTNPTLRLAERLLTGLENDPVAFNVLTRRIHATPPAAPSP